MTEWEIIRTKKQYTQKEMSEYLGISQSLYSKYELGKRYVPVKLMIKMMKLYPKFYASIINIMEKGEKNNV